MSIKIRKANGELVDFDESKIVDALIRSGARPDEATKVLNHVLKTVKDGVSTAKIYQRALLQLRKISGFAAGRYQLKRAVFELGPGGYPFEKFVARLLESKGFETQTNVIEMGRCVRHELDVVAENSFEKIMVECKFHRDQGQKNDVKIPLYIQSRFLDMKQKWESEGETRKITGMIVSNTRFTTDAEDFGKCVGLRLVGWDYPNGHGLRNWIDKSGLHPITTVNTIPNALKAVLMEKGIVLCREILDKSELLLQLGLTEQKVKTIIEEARLITDANR
ncbi:MAG: restriction endonuclease [Bacteroidales bacterium]|nr:restriction endonuclease [Bacteroidales bacterium]